MGSLTSRPKLPPVQQPYIVTMPPPASTSAPTITASTPDTSADNTTAVEGDRDEQAQTEARETGLLNRSRGRLGTVLTSFRGVLSSGDTGEQRKRLLGE